MKFFRQNPSIEQVANGFALTYRGLTGLVDSCLLAVNNPSRIGECHPQYNQYIDRIRKRQDAFVKKYDAEDFEIKGCPKRPFSERITYRIPTHLACAQVALDKHLPGNLFFPIGRCEEHTFLTLYFLTIGHMIQDMPFGRLRDDILYAAVWEEPEHAFVILVKGSEFKIAVQQAKEAAKAGDDNTVSWLIDHTESWGENAWIIDGWRGNKSKLLKDYSERLSYFRTETVFLRNRFRTMHFDYIYQVAKDVGLAPDFIPKAIVAPQLFRLIPALSPRQLESFFQHEKISTQWDLTVRGMVKLLESSPR